VIVGVRTDVPDCDSAGKAMDFRAEIHECVVKLHSSTSAAFFLATED